MEIGKFKLAKADLVRPPKKPIQEQIIPKEKPYTKEVFQIEVDPFIKGFIGGFPKNEMTMKLQSILDKAVEKGALTTEEGVDYMRNRKQQLLDFVEQNPGETLPELGRENFAFGTEKPVTQTNDFGNIQVADLKDDLTPGPLKDELDGKYDPSQETYEEYLQRINLDRPFNASLEESTTGPGGYPMTAGLTTIPKAANTAINLFEAGKVGIRDAVKITKDFLNRRQIHEPTGLAGDKKDYTKEKDFLQVFNKLKNKFFQGDTTKTNRALGVYDRLAKDIERRVIQSEKGTRVKGQDDRFLFYEPSVPEPVKGMSWPETTTSMKKNPDKFLSLKVGKENPNKFLDKKSLANYLGIKFEKDDVGKLTKFGKTQSDAFMTRLTNLGVKKTNQGLFDTNDAINKLVKVSEQKLVKGERKSEMGAGRYKLEKKFDPELFSVREGVKKRIEKRSKALDFYIPRGVDDLGHPYSITKSENKYKNLFKDSNMNRLNTLVYQDPLINKELFKTSGYESKHDKMFDALSKIRNKKVTPEIQKQLLQIKNDLNQNYNNVKNIIKNPKELIKYLPENTDPKYVNYLSKSHIDRVQKIDINIPKVGETFKSKDVFADMSSVNPKYIAGYVNNINPNAKKFKDLSLAEQELYKQNLLMQNSEIVSDFIKKAGATAEEAEEIREGITMPYSTGGRVGFKEGTPKQPIFSKGAASQLAKISLANPLGLLTSSYLLGGSDALDPRTSEGRMTLGAEAAFAPSLVRGSQEIVRKMSPEKRRVVQRLLNLGASPLKAIKYARALTPIGIATLLGEGVYQGGKYMLERKKLLESLTDEQRDELLRKEKQEAVGQMQRGDPEAFEGIMAANGGLISRAGFRGGGADMGGVADSQGNVGPSGGGNNDGPDDRSSAAQTAAHNAAVAAAQQTNVADNKMNILDTLSRFRPDTYVNPYNYSIGLNKYMGPLSLNADINTFGILGIDDPRTSEDESEQDDYGIRAGFNADVLGGNLNLGGSYSPTSGTNFGLNFYKQFNKGGRVSFADGPEDPSKRKFMKIVGGLASLPIVGKFFDVAQVAEKAAPAVIETFKNAPPHFVGLVNKIRALGKIVEPKKLLPSEEKRFSNVYDYGDYRMYEGKDGQIEISKEKLVGTDYGDAKVSEEYMSYNPKSPKIGKEGKMTGETEPQYDEYTAYADQDGKMKDVYDGIEESTKIDGTYSKEELEQLIIEQVEQNLKKGKK